MSNEMTTPNTTAVLDDIEGFAGLTKAAKTVAANDRAPTAGRDTLLRMGRDGVWVYGPENIEVQDGSRWAIDPRTLLRGFVCWTRWSKEELRAGNKNQLLGEVFVPVDTVRPDKSTLPVHYKTQPEGSQEPLVAWEWADAMSVEMTCQNGEDRGLVVLYKVSSVGGLRALDDYFEKFLDRVDTGNVIAEVSLGSDHYEHSDWGKTYTPEITYHEWRVPGPGCGLTTHPNMGLIDYGSGSAKRVAKQPVADAEPEDTPEVEEDVVEEPEARKPKPRGRTRPAA